jgi:hypothetical protein
MDNNTSHLEDLKIIRKVMEESSRFLSLSGLSGIFAGLFALAGASVAYFGILKNGTIRYDEYLRDLPIKEAGIFSNRLIADALVVLLLSLGISLYFSIRKSKRTALQIWTPVSKRMLINLLIPLISGGIFIIGLLIYNSPGLIVPGMLLFYGLALVNAGKFTFNEVFYLGLLEIITGLIAVFLPDLGIYFWAFGFGILHIIYGLIMLGKYER